MFPVNPALAIEAVPRPVRRAIGVTLFGVAALALLVLLVGSTLDALQAAGLNGKAPSNANPIKKAIDDLTENWKWLIATGFVGLASLFLGLLMFGSRQAPEMLFKIGAGIFGLLVVVPAVLQ